MALVTPVAVVLVGGADGGIFAFFRYEDEAGGIPKTQRPEKDGIYYTEDGGVCTDAESEREDGDQREGRALREETKGVAQVLQQSLHSPPTEPVTSVLGLQTDVTSKRFTQGYGSLLPAAIEMAVGRRTER